MTDLAYPDDKSAEELLWNIPGIAEISFEPGTGTVTGVRPKTMPETVPSEYDALDIDQILAIARDHRLALRDGRLLADLIASRGA